MFLVDDVAFVGGVTSAIKTWKTEYEKKDEK